jgi:hypothetical protein
MFHRLMILGKPSTSAPSLRAERSNPGTKKKNWIASSQELLAMTELAFPNQLKIIKL